MKKKMKKKTKKVMTMMKQKKKKKKKKRGKSGELETVTNAIGEFVSQKVIHREKR